METKGMDINFINNLNRNIQNESSNINSIKGFEVISEALVYNIFDIFGRNSLLSMLYQTGSGPGEKIAKRIQEKNNKSEFEIFEALELLMKELRDFYSIQIREVQEFSDNFKIIIENHCFLRDSIKHRKRLKPGKALCRINKGYFETAFRILLGDKIKKIEINFLHDDIERDVCVEELVFYPSHL